MGEKSEQMSWSANLASFELSQAYSSKSYSVVEDLDSSSRKLNTSEKAPNKVQFDFQANAKTRYHPFQLFFIQLVQLIYLMYLHRSSEQYQVIIITLCSLFSMFIVCQIVICLKAMDQNKYLKCRYIDFVLIALAALFSLPCSYNLLQYSLFDGAVQKQTEFLYIGGIFVIQTIYCCFVYAAMTGVTAISLFVVEMDSQDLLTSILIFTVYVIVCIFQYLELGNIDSASFRRTIDSSQGKHLDSTDPRIGFSGSRLPDESSLLGDLQHIPANSNSGIENLTVKLLSIEELVRKEQKRKTIKSSQLDDVLQLLLESKMVLGSTKNLYQASLMDIMNESKDEEEREFLANYLESESNLKQLGQSERSEVQQIPEELPKLEHSNSMFIYDFEKLEAALSMMCVNFNLDMFFINEICSAPVRQCGRYVVKYYNLQQALQIPQRTLDSFLRELESKYLDNPYHNAIHAADTLNSMLWLLENTKLQTSLTYIELLAVIVASLGHDVGHLGKTNRFLIATRHEMAIRYNDNSVQENMHASLIWEMLAYPKQNILCSLTTEQWQVVRTIVVGLVLATDVQRDFDAISSLRAKLKATEGRTLPVEPYIIRDPQERLYFLEILIKAADKGYSAKLMPVHSKWADLLVEEMFEQGDEERELDMDVTLFCDRDSTNVAKMQYLFMLNIARPLFSCINQYFQSNEVGETIMSQLNINLNTWKKRSKDRTRSNYVRPKDEPMSPYETYEQPRYSRRISTLPHKNTLAN